ncbi:gene transfer agent family protein [Methylobacterium tardum]|uniref:gene transfer agent family protein n=1 Tax=Methylobacterium tardum TaxID=374432 RepID=UPI00360B0D3E
MTADFAGRPCRFQLRLGEMTELERLCGAGIGAIFMRLGTHQFSHRDVWDTIRLGLEGGGMSGIAASALVLHYQDDPLMDHLPLAAGSWRRRSTACRRRATRRETPRPRGGDSRPADLSVFYGAGAVAGFAPEEVRRMTLAEWHVIVAAFIAAHGPPEAGAARTSSWRCWRRRWRRGERDRWHQHREAGSITVLTRVN